MTEQQEIKHLKRLLAMAEETIACQRKQIDRMEVSHRQYDHAIGEIHRVCHEEGIPSGNVVFRVRQLAAKEHPQLSFC